MNTRMYGAHERNDWVNSKNVFEYKKIMHDLVYHNAGISDDKLDKKSEFDCRFLFKKRFS